MNVFFLDKHPERAANLLCDEHSNKMITESCQLLSSVYHMLDDPNKDNVYKLAHKNHPSAKWARQSEKSFLWLARHTQQLIKNYDRRFGKPKFNRAREIVSLSLSSPPSLLPDVPVLPAFFAFGNPEFPELHAKYTALKPQFGFYDLDFDVWRSDDPDETVEAYKTYYKLKIFKQEKLPTWARNPNGSPSWYTHTDTCLINND